MLDGIRLQNSRDRTRELFRRQYGQDPEQAVSLLNEDGLQFPTLFILQPEISKFALGEALNVRNRLALKISGDLITRRHPAPGPDGTEIQDVLRWMFTTGSGASNMGDEYDTVMDMAALLLVREYHETENLSLLEEMIFSRHRKGGYTGDAEWALFECRDPGCLSMLAGRLRSADVRDVVLARRLLGFIPCMEKYDDATRQYQCVMQWLGRNGRFLQYTGESSQRSSRPRPFKVALEQKYLQRPLSADERLREDDGEAVAALSAPEQSRLGEFRRLSAEEKELLSEYSQQLHMAGGGQWQRWISAGAPEQIASAKRWQEGMI